MSIAVLLRAKILIWKNTLSRRTGRQQVSMLALLALTFYLGYGIFRGIISLFQMLAGAPAGVAEAFLTTALSGLITFALFWGLGAMLTRLYVDSDLELLLAAPVPPWAIYSLKLLEGLGSLLFPAVLSLACMVAYGVVTGGSWIYYLLVILGFALLAVFLTAAAMAVVMLIVRFLPARRTREAWVLIWTVGVGLVWMAWMISSNQGSRGAWLQRILANEPLVVQTGRILGWSPAGWLARMLVAWQNGHTTSAVIFLGLLLIAGGVMFYVGYLVYQRAFYYGWSSMHEVAPRLRARRGARPEGQRRIPGFGWLPMQVRGIVSKEWRILPRDVRQLSGLFFPILMGIVYIYITATGDLASQLPGAVSWIALAISPMVPFFMTLYHSVGVIGLEGREFALLRVAPLAPAKLLWAKFLASFGPTLLISELVAILIGVVMGASWAQLLLAIIAMIWFTAGFVAVGIGAATWEPNFKAANARRAVGTGVIYAVLLLNAAFWVVQIALLAWLLIQVGPAPVQGILGQLVALVAPQIAPWVDSGVTLVLLLAAEVAVWGGIAYLWWRGMRWIENWEITALG